MDLKLDTILCYEVIEGTLVIECFPWKSDKFLFHDVLNS